MKLGAIADARGVEMNDLADDDLVTDVIVIVKVLGNDGQVYACMGVSDGTDWFNMRAMTEYAYNAVREDE